MANSKLEKYIRREIHVKDSEPPVLRLYGDESLKALGLLVNFSINWRPITKSQTMAKVTHAHDFDQFLCFIGGDINNMLDLGGEVEFTLSEDGKNLEKFVFTRATVVYVRKGLYHGPINLKVNDPNKPILFHDLYFSPEYGRKDVNGKKIAVTVDTEPLTR